MDDILAGGRSGGAANPGQANDLPEVGQSKSPISSRNNSLECPTGSARYRAEVDRINRATDREIDAAVRVTVGETSVLVSRGWTWGARRP